MIQKEEIANLQSSFLNQFSETLSEYNQSIWQHLLLQEAVYKQDEKLMMYFVKFKQSCQELGEYLKGIQQFSKLGNDQKIVAAFEDVSLKPFVERILRQFESLIEENKIDIVLSISATDRVQTDPNILEPIIFNLISNAIKYSPAGGSVVIDLQELGADTVRFIVKDHGIGIADDYLDKIFEKFYRIKDDYVYKIKGHGLGLYLCQYFATKLGTSIDVESQLGEGSEFSLLLRRSK